MKFVGKSVQIQGSSVRTTLSERQRGALTNEAVLHSAVGFLILSKTEMKRILLFSKLVD